MNTHDRRGRKAHFLLLGLCGGVMLSLLVAHVHLGQVARAQDREIVVLLDQHKTETIKLTEARMQLWWTRMEGKAFGNDEVLADIRWARERVQGQDCSTQPWPVVERVNQMADAGARMIERRREGERACLRELYHTLTPQNDPGDRRAVVMALTLAK